MTLRPEMSGGNPVNAATMGLEAQPAWHTSYWLVAALPALLLFGSDGLEILMYEHARAPNAGIVAQLSLLLVFYAAWPLVPWLIWKTVSQNLPGQSDVVTGFKHIIGKLGLLGLGANLLHLTLLAIVLRILYSPPGWGVMHLVDSVVELWIQNAGLWFFVYLVFCLGIYYFIVRGQGPAETQPSPVYKVRTGNKIVPVKMTDVSWIEACGNYAQLHSQQGVFLVRKSLATIEQEMKAYAVVRSHRSALVNTDFVSAITRDATDGQYRIELRCGETAPLSRRRLASFKAKIASH